jgi:hypothetical protein
MAVSHASVLLLCRCWNTVLIDSALRARCSPECTAHARSFRAVPLAHELLRRPTIGSIPMTSKPNPKSLIWRTAADFGKIRLIIRYNTQEQDQRIEKLERIACLSYRFNFCQKYTLPQMLPHLTPVPVNANNVPPGLKCSRSFKSLTDVRQWIRSQMKPEYESTLFPVRELSYGLARCQYGMATYTHTQRR